MTRHITCTGCFCTLYELYLIRELYAVAYAVFEAYKIAQAHAPYKREHNRKCLCSHILQSYTPLLLSQRC